MQTLEYTLAFAVVCLASHVIGKIFSKIKLPYITGYLFAGALASPFGLDFLPTEAAADLRFVDEISLAVIAFVAGSELYLKEIRKRLQRILWTTGGIFVIAVVLGIVGVYFATTVLPFTAGLDPTSRFAVALLGATVLLALSPPSTIAVIREVRARGPFTQTALGVTVLMDVVIIVFFAIATSLASVLLTGTDFSIGFVGVLALDLTLALTLGYVVARLLSAILSAGWAVWLKTALVVALGFGIFQLAGLVKSYSAAELPFEIYIEPLLIALVGGFVVTNFTPHREQFDRLLHGIGPAVYVAFFTITGLSLKLDLLWATLPVAAALFGVRALSLFIGAQLGGKFAGIPANERRISWMAFITQAGIALGLAREVAVQFPSLGDAFATLIISVVVLNEIFGPLFLKSALRKAGEAHEPETADGGDVRDVAILGVSGPSVELARQLASEGWTVRLGDTDSAQVSRFLSSLGEGERTPTLLNLDGDLSNGALTSIIPTDTDAVVALFPDEALNVRVCEYAYERGVRRVVARVREPEAAARLREIGVLVVDPASAMVTLLDQAVRAPQSAALLMHQQDGRDVVQMTLRNEALDGLLVRDLRLPGDVLLLDIYRDGSSIVPHGQTRLREGDEITLLGSQDALDTAAVRLGY
jgi:Trk K+ transport system NAD-binding subunit/Kef-type K+ transport system membrane component KefB